MRDGYAVDWPIRYKDLAPWYSHVETQFTEMFTAAGFKNIKAIDNKRKPGNENHEMGGVRMGSDPATSMLNKWNQLHQCKNVFVTDGA